MQPIRIKRRVQFICAVFLHIPLVAIAAYALSEGFMNHAGILLVCLVATLLATLMIVPYLGRVLDGGNLEAAR
ncbi:MAG: hypothetical protein GYB53_17705 [Rhodobacteraceae bacterium]|nr:hypothetical protein [Paracoccaceae bacterium]MBR9821837.1 hypothetical protein [Paracoccaceae bacterium]